MRSDDWGHWEERRSDDWGSLGGEGEVMIGGHWEEKAK